ncbi:MAG: nitrous oxide reductase accessory protein NosL [Bacteroidales bacterium]
MQLRLGARRATVGLAVVAAVACGPGTPPPAALDTRNDACAHCRMMVSSQRFAAQIVAPSEEPKFFDDVGCLREYLQQRPDLAAGTTAYVADHRTGEWVAADHAVFTHTQRVQTPMASGVIAHDSVSSRDRDGAAAGGENVAAANILGPLMTRGQR